MKLQFVNWKKSLCGIALLALCVAPAVHAHPFGGFFGGGGAQNRPSSTAASYNPAGNVGNATIMVDPDTHNLIISADEDTTKAMMEVIKNIDHPQPQVLIKV